MDLEVLDQEEKYRLAIHALRQQRYTEALLLLKRADPTQASDPQRLYLLGVLYADIGLPERAVAHLALAIDVDPLLATARFQLGLLLLTLGRTAQAVEVWQQLDLLDAAAPLRLFRDALQHLLADELAPCRRLLALGIDANRDNPALNDDMRRLLAQLDDMPADNGAASSVFRHVHAGPG